MLLFIYSKKYTKLIKKNYIKMHENFQVTYIIEKSYLHPSEIYKIYTDHQEKLNIIRIQCLYSEINSLKT